MTLRKNVIVVDDNMDLITIVKTTLEAKGYNLASASSGDELFSRLEETRPGVILLDIMMPQIDGLEVLKRLRGRSDTSSIPVILLTAKAQYQDILTGYKQGADYYITKPFTSS
jgi:CheY-like chemotaxis protein